MRPSAPKISLPGKFATVGVDRARVGIEAGDGGFREKLGSGGFGLAAKPVVEHVSRDGARSSMGRPEGMLVKGAALAVDVKSADFLMRQRGVRFGQAKSLPDLPGDRVDAVAANLGARKSSAVKQGHAMAGPGQDERGDGTGRRSADNDDVVGRHFLH